LDSGSQVRIEDMAAIRLLNILWSVCMLLAAAKVIVHSAVTKKSLTLIQNLFVGKFSKN
jgi:hypothetical protein